MFNFNKKEKSEVSGSEDQRKEAAMNPQAAKEQEFLANYPEVRHEEKKDGDGGHSEASESK